MTTPTGPDTHATLVAAADVPSFPVGQTMAGLVATGSQTDGHYGLFRWDMSAALGGATAHYHRTFSEAFFVLDGRIQLFDGTDWREGTAGDLLYVPPSGVHGFRNESREPAAMLLFTPGAPREDYFETLADAARRAAMDDDDWAAFFLRHDTFWV